MKYAFLVFLFSASIHVGFSQNNQLWKDYFSYNNIQDISQSDTKLYAGSENAVFSKNISTNEIKTINTIDGLSGESVSAIYHSAALNKTIVGYQNGLLTVINETDGKILKVVDIINKQLPPNIKKINHFMEYQGIVYISCDFGIVLYDLKNLLFGDTYFIGTSKSEIIVNQTAVLNGFLYASTIDEGIKKADLANPNLVDPTNWTQIASGSFVGVTTFSNNIFAVQTNGQILRSADGNNFSNFGSSSSSAVVDLRSTATNLLVSTANNIYVYNSQFALETQIDSNLYGELAPVFTCTTTINDKLFIGTQNEGVIATTTFNPSVFDLVRPNGPARNNSFSITAEGGNLWATYGGYDQNYTPRGIKAGFSKFNSETGWDNLPFGKVDGTTDLVRITVNPSKNNEIYVSSHQAGLLKYQDANLVFHYDQSNSGLESLFYAPDPNYKSVRIEQSVFDKKGNLWMANDLVQNGLKVKTPNDQWQSYNMGSILNDPTFNSARFGRITIDKNGTKWIASLFDGLIGFNESKNLFRKITVGADTGNLPDAAVQVGAIDHRNQIWIGTRRGLRVLPGVDRFLTGEKLTANPIIILEEGVPQELMHDQFITDIVVDGANNKWIGTLSAGVFLLSENGQETLHHFTTSNSPLPSNNINDIDINSTTGEVFFATVNGIVSFKGTAIKASDNLNNVFVYPNPVRPEFTGAVKIAGLLDKADVKITDIEGNLVHEVISEGGSVEWDTTAFGKYKVQSGVYMIFVSSEDGAETQVKKVMIIR